MYDLEKELIRLRENFNIKLSQRMQLKSVQSEIDVKIEKINIVNQSSKPNRIRKWLQLFNITFK